MVLRGGNSSSDEHQLDGIDSRNANPEGQQPITDSEADNKFADVLIQTPDSI